MHRGNVKRTLDYKKLSLSSVNPRSPSTLARQTLAQLPLEARGARGHAHIVLRLLVDLEELRLQLERAIDLKMQRVERVSWRLLLYLQKGSSQGPTDTAKFVQPKQGWSLFSVPAELKSNCLRNCNRERSSRRQSS